MRIQELPQLTVEAVTKGKVELEVLQMEGEGRGGEGKKKGLKKRRRKP